MEFGKNIEIASHETLQDAIKWVAFGFFAVIYFGLNQNNTFLAITFVLAFSLIIFMINILKQKSLGKINKLFS